MLRLAALLCLLVCSVGSPLSGQARYFVTALGGVSAISADAATQLGPPIAVALYSPGNGAAANIGAGYHSSDWISLQANYIWNRNPLTLNQVNDRAFFQQERNTRQHAGVVDFLLYFRNRRSWARPYLSAGAGVVSIADTLGGLRGELEPPPKLSEARALLRVAVGIDLLHSSGWGFRYSFSESISGNPYSAILRPQGPRNLANFQNLFGFVRYF